MASSTAAGGQGTHVEGEGPEETKKTTDYTIYNNDDLIAKITSLERQLHASTLRLAELTAQNSTSQPSSPSVDSTQASTISPSSLPVRVRSRTPSPRRVRPFDPSQYSTRHIALRFAYLGHRYNGFEHTNGTVMPKPTIEEVLWKALRKTRLISPDMNPGLDGVPLDESGDVIWDTAERLKKYTDGRDGGARGQVKLDVRWEGCQYSKCGRTDRGVSAFGQVIGIRVRSNKPLEKDVVPQSGLSNKPIAEQNSDDSPSLADSTMPMIAPEDLDTDTYTKPFHHIADEISYLAVLNSTLPPDIRILAWCPTPPPTFDARFSCRERRYKYIFTNPAFSPTPGAHGLRLYNGKPAATREGWLNINKMREAAKKLEGSHDFRNFCKIDPSKQMPNCQRRVTFADVVEFETPGKEFTLNQALNLDGTGSIIQSVLSGSIGDGVTESGPKAYAFCVHGTAFLWHQVRCMVSLLFLVGQGLEEPSIIDELLDVERNPRRPMYEMADDAPLVLWDCIFPETDHDMTDSLGWVYSGDEISLPALTTKGDGKFGTRGIVDDLWQQWREAKTREVLAGSLLDLAISQGDGSPLQRGGQRGPIPAGHTRSAKVFDGGDSARVVGRYIPVMQKPKLESLAVQNERWAKTRGAKREARKAMAGPA